MNNKNNAKEQITKQRKPLPKTRLLSNTGSLKSNLGGGADLGGGVITRTCSGGCPQTSYCTYTC